MKYLLGDKLFIKKLFGLALPIIIQNFFESLMYLVNSLMMGKLGDSTLAAVGIASQVVFVLMVFLFGINSGTSMFVAQFFGSNDVKSIRKINFIAIVIGGLVSISFTIAFMTMPSFIMSLFSKDIEVINIGAQYLSYAAFGLIPMSISFAIIFCLRGVGDVKRASIILGISTFLGVIMGYIFIFGFIGIKPMGAGGAAIGLALSRWIELVVLIFVILTKKELIPKLSDIFEISTSFVLNFLQKTIPVILNEIMWVIGITTFAVVYGRLGTDISAASNIFLTVEKMGVVLFWGISQSCAIIVGNHIGAGDIESAYRDAGRILSLGFVLAFVMSGILFLCRYEIIGLFNVSKSASSAALIIINIFLILLPFKAINIINLVGVLRAGGDTKYAFVMEFVVLWLLAVPATFYSAFSLGLTLSAIYLAQSTEEVIKFFIGVRRYKSRKWINNLTEI